MIYSSHFNQWFLNLEVIAFHFAVISGVTKSQETGWLHHVFYFAKGILVLSCFGMLQNNHVPVVATVLQVVFNDPCFFEEWPYLNIEQTDIPRTPSRPQLMRQSIINTGTRTTGPIGVFPPLALPIFCRFYRIPFTTHEKNITHVVQWPWPNYLISHVLFLPQVWRIIYHFLDILIQM